MITPQLVGEVSPPVSHDWLTVRPVYANVERIALPRGGGVQKLDPIISKVSWKWGLKMTKNQWKRESIGVKIKEIKLLKIC